MWMIKKLFTLVDAAYNQPITNQPSDSYRQALLAKLSTSFR